MTNQFGCFNLSADLGLFQKQCLSVLILGKTTEKKSFILYSVFPMQHKVSVALREYCWLL